MIEIRTCEHGFSAVGHAGHGPPGWDIVCASVSALVQTFVASAEELTDTKLHCELSPGRAVVLWGESTRELTLLLDSFLLGARGIAGSDPECVRIF